MQAFGDSNNVLLFSEIRIKNVGSFDFVLVKHKPLSSDIEDFCVVEFQSDSTTGTGELVEALKDFMKNNKNPNAQEKHYAFGMNTYNTIKLSYIQMLVKAQVLESWNKKIFWVMQNFVFDNMVSRFHLNNLEFDENVTTQYHIYDLEKSNHLYQLSLKSKYSSTVSNLLKAFTHQSIPSKEEFIKLLQQKINLKVGLTLTK